MRIRLALPLEAEQLAAIDASQPMSAHWDVQGWKGELTSAAAQVWVAEEEGNVIAFSACRLAAGFCEILNVAVLPAFCRRGIAFALLSHLLAQVRAQGGQTVTLEVNCHNGPALALYRKAGLKEMGRRKKFYHNQEDALIMGAEL